MMGDVLWIGLNAGEKGNDSALAMVANKETSLKMSSAYSILCLGVVADGVDKERKE